MLHELLQQQSVHGGFPSQVETRVGFMTDENCFVTASVLFELLQVAERNPSPALTQAIERGIHFIESCEMPGQPGHFRFYPYHDCTPRLPIALNPDLDDAALALIVLHKAGRRSKAVIAGLIQTFFEPNKIVHLTGKEPPWVKPGIYRTWINQKAVGNAADCCVNLNILGLYALAGAATGSTAQAIMQAVKHALELFGTGTAAMRRVAPYYAHAAELFYCMQRATRLGASQLEAVLAALRDAIILQHGEQSFLLPQRPVCCDAQGSPIWISPALQQARQLNTLHT